ncbi:MAG: alpha-ketoacid dehydrogenase subunit beta [Sulfolobales archaeon]|nr:alpha-ketoacid dehydrogenase subunit beta [Sulfolobales archaeon]
MPVRELTYAEALREALREEMLRDDRVFLMGEDVGVIGGVFKVTQGLYEEFGQERVRDTPISETAIVGAAIGAAIAGMKPVAEIMYMDFLMCAGDQVINHLPKIRYMSGGKLKVPAVIRTQYGLYRYAAAQHSQFYPAFLMNIPGMYVEVPSTPYDAKGLLKSAIRDENPDIFIECAALYRVRGPVPDEDYVIPLGQADVKREGRDVTVFALSYMVHVALSAAQKLGNEGISTEVIDPRTLNPFDKKTLVESVKKTGRLVIIEPDHKTAGVGAEVAAIVAEDAYDYLKAPIVRLAADDIPPPFAPKAYNAFLPNEEKLISSIKKLIKQPK